MMPEEVGEYRESPHRNTCLGGNLHFTELAGIARMKIDLLLGTTEAYLEGLKFWGPLLQLWHSFLSLPARSYTCPCMVCKQTVPLRGKLPSQGLV